MNFIDIIVETTQALVANPQDVEACKKRAFALSEMGQYKEALEDLNTLIDTLNVQDDANLYSLRGAIRMKLEDKKGALDDMRKAMQLNPELLRLLGGHFTSDTPKS